MVSTLTIQTLVRRSCIPSDVILLPSQHGWRDTVPAEVGFEEVAGYSTRMLILAGLSWGT